MYFVLWGWHTCQWTELTRYLLPMIKSYVKNGIECIAFVVLLAWHLHSYSLLLISSLILPFQQHKWSFSNSRVAGVLSTTNRQVVISVTIQLMAMPCYGSLSISLLLMVWYFIAWQSWLQSKWWSIRAGVYAEGKMVPEEGFGGQIFYICCIMMITD